MTKQLFIRVSGSYAVALAFVALLIALSAGAAPTRATSGTVAPRTLFIEKGTIHKFAQDGDRIAWVGGRHYDVHFVACRSGGVGCSVMRGRDRGTKRAP